QVHRAALKDGTKVVLKIQRPGIRPIIESDMRLLAYLASLAEKFLPELAAYHPQKVIQHFAKSLQNELNFVTEGHNATPECSGIRRRHPGSEPRGHRCGGNGPNTHCPNRGECGAQNDHDRRVV